MPPCQVVPTPQQHNCSPLLRNHKLNASRPLCAKPAPYPQDPIKIHATPGQGPSPPFDSSMCLPNPDTASQATPPPAVKREDLKDLQNLQNTPDPPTASPALLRTTTPPADQGPPLPLLFCPDPDPEPCHTPSSFVKWGDALLANPPDPVASHDSGQQPADLAPASRSAVPQAPQPPRPIQVINPGQDPPHPPPSPGVLTLGTAPPAKWDDLLSPDPPSYAAPKTTPDIYLLQPKRPPDDCTAALNLSGPLLVCSATCGPRHPTLRAADTPAAPLPDLILSAHCRKTPPRSLLPIPVPPRAHRALTLALASLLAPPPPPPPWQVAMAAGAIIPKGPRAPPSYPPAPLLLLSLS